MKSINTYLICVVLASESINAEIYMVHDPDEHKIAIVEMLDDEGNGRITRFSDSTYTTHEAINIIYIRAFNAIFIQFNGLSLNLPLIDEANYCGEDATPCRMLEPLFCPSQ